MKYVSCELAQHGLCFINGNLWSCCYAPGDKVDGSNGVVTLIENYHGESLHYDDLFSLIEQRKNDFKNGIINPACEGCYWLKEQEWDEEKYFNQIYITHFEKCNANCFYCSGCQDRDRDNITKPYDVLPILHDMKDKGIMPKGTEFHIGGGEPTLYHELDSIIKDFAMTGYVKKIFVPTSGILYSETLSEALSKNLASIIVSLDSGSGDVYKKIKRVDKFDKVVENLRRYASDDISKGNILMKYIEIEGMNDSLDEFKRFMDILNSIGLNRIALDLEATYARQLDYNISDKFLKFIVKAKDLAEKNGFDVETYMFYKQALSLAANRAGSSNLFSKVALKLSNLIGLKK